MNQVRCPKYNHLIGYLTARAKSCGPAVAKNIVHFDTERMNVENKSLRVPVGSVKSYAQNCLQALAE